MDTMTFESGTADWSAEMIHGLLEDLEYWLSTVEGLNPRKLLDKHGNLHAPSDEPARVTQGGTSMWAQRGRLHRQDSPALIDPVSNSVAWYCDGVLHRSANLPASISHKSILWYENGRRHRDDGLPSAVHLSDGIPVKFEWHQNGVLHRRDGHAVERRDGQPNEFWIGGDECSPNEFVEQLTAEEVEYLSLNASHPEVLRIIRKSDRCPEHVRSFLAMSDVT